MSTNHPLIILSSDFFQNMTPGNESDFDSKRPCVFVEYIGRFEYKTSPQDMRILSRCCTVIGEVSGIVNS